MIRDEQYKQEVGEEWAPPEVEDELAKKRYEALRARNKAAFEARVRNGYVNRNPNFGSEESGRVRRPLTDPNKYDPVANATRMLQPFSKLTGLDLSDQHKCNDYVNALRKLEICF